MAALKKQGFTLAPFKCGPDFIDPTLHNLVTGKISRNLDIWMSGETFVNEIFSSHTSKADIAVIEGVMGMFDGGLSSSGALAEFLQIPVILVLDVRSTAESAAAVLKGFETFNPQVHIGGVILNMIGSPKHLKLASDAIKDHCQTEILGYLPRNIDFSIPSRHLGLHMGEESPITQNTIDHLADTVIDHINMAKLVETAASSPSDGSPIVARKKHEVRLAVARDKAFCFYYEDNLDIFRQAGAEICFFSPLSDHKLPENIDAIYLGGGYPELYGKELSGNISLLQEIRQWGQSGGPIYAECGGFMYLTEGITDDQNTFHPLVSIFPVKAAMQKKRVSLGYREVHTTHHSFFGPEGTILRGHEFHYSIITDMDSSIERLYNVNNGASEGYRIKNVLGGYMHLHFGYNRKAAEHFIAFCKG